MIDRKFSPGRFPETRQKLFFGLTSYTAIHEYQLLLSTLRKQLTNINRHLTDPAVTEAYVQRGTEIQVVYPTDSYLSAISLQFEQSVIFVPKFTMLTKNYKDIV